MKISLPGLPYLLFRSLSNRYLYLFQELSPENRVRKKNKDVTGTKIKRSKRKIEDNICVAIVDSEISSTKNARGAECEDQVSLNYKNSSVDKIHEDDAMDVESFIRNQEPIQSYEFRDYVPGRDDLSPEHDHKNEFNDKHDKVSVFIADEVNIDEEIPNTECIPLIYSEESQSLIDNEDDPVYSLETQVDDEIENKKQIDDGIENKIQIDNTDIQSINADIIKTNGDLDINISFDNTNHSIKNEDNIEDALNAEVNNEINVAENTKVESNAEDNTGKADQQTNDTEISEPPKKDVMDKLRELEEKMLKKFKGTLLDKLF